MATTNGVADPRTELTSWLKTILKDENLEDFSVEIIGNSEKGDGYMGDIVFASVNGVKNNEPKKYDVVLKCSKRSEALRKKSPVREAFLNEILMYETILPYFTKFQKEKGIKDPFNSIPKCYGSLTTENMEVIVLENLKSVGYELWPKKQPLTRKHVDLMVTQYAKLHATSLAIEIQNPEEFHRMTNSFRDLFDDFYKTSDMHVLFGNPIDMSHELLQNELEEDILQRWKGLKTQIEYICVDMMKNVSGIKVILHGDCWSNNFMHLHKDNAPSKVAFLDWQVSSYSSPIFDLSYFLLSCISEEDIEQLDEILLTYHTTFIDHLRQLGVEQPEELYPLGQFLNEWKSLSRYGVLMGSLLMKIVSTDKDEVVDMAQFAESGEDIINSFTQEIRDKDNYRKRILPLVKYAAKHDLI